MTLWTASCQAPLSFIISWNLLKLTSIEPVRLSNYLFLCHSLLLLSSIFPNISVFSSESALIQKKSQSLKQPAWPSVSCFSETFFDFSSYCVAFSLPYSISKDMLFPVSVPKAATSDWICITASFTSLQLLFKVCFFFFLLRIYLPVPLLIGHRPPQSPSFPAFFPVTLILYSLLYIYLSSWYLLFLLLFLSPHQNDSHVKTLLKGYSYFLCFTLSYVSQK